MLTKKQHELLLYIASRLRETGIPPSFEEMKVALGLRSKSGIHRLMTALEERGFLKRLPHRARAVEILRLPDNVAPMRSAIRIVSSGESPPRAEALQNNKARPPLAASIRQGVSLPFYGKIAAGTPIEALRDTSQTIEVPSSLISESSEYYALRVDGDSMIEAGILNGDIVIIERAEAAENGTIVVALVNNEEVTLKRLRRRKKSIALEPANAAFETKLFGPDQVKVQGRLSALIRTYDYT
jgi:repressor LexA